MGSKAEADNHGCEVKRVGDGEGDEKMADVVSRILRVHGSSRHKPNSKNLQNKQGTRGGVPAGSLMLKLVKEVESVLSVKSLAYIFTYIFLSVASLIYEEGSWSTFHGEWVFGF